MNYFQGFLVLVEIFEVHNTDIFYLWQLIRDMKMSNIKLVFKIARLSSLFEYLSTVFHLLKKSVCIYMYSVISHVIEGLAQTVAKKMIDPA